MFEKMTVADYKEIYEKVLALSFDADGFRAFTDTKEEDVEKCIWIAAILDVLNDVPCRKMEHIFRRKKLTVDWAKFWKENYES